MYQHTLHENESTLRILTGGENNPTQNQRQHDHETQEQGPSHQSQIKYVHLQHALLQGPEQPQTR